MWEEWKKAEQKFLKKNKRIKKANHLSLSLAPYHNSWIAVRVVYSTTMRLHTLTTFFAKKPTLLCAEEVKTNTTFLGIANSGTFLSVRWY